MRADADGKPSLSADGKGLAVRPPGTVPLCDVDVDEDGKVVLNRKGMSVAPSIRAMPYFLIPEKYSGTIPKARGRNLTCFVRGEGAFEDSRVADKLVLCKDSDSHAVVSPESAMTLEELQTALAATRDEWIVTEDLL